MAATEIKIVVIEVLMIFSSPKDLLLTAARDVVGRVTLIGYDRF